MSDNKGITLVELIVVISLMAVLVGGVGYGISLLIGQQSTGCANNVSIALDKAKNYASTRSAGSDAYMEIKKETNGGYVAVYYVPEKPHTVGTQTVYKELERMELGSGQLEMLCYFEGGSSASITGAQSLRIYYDRIDGSMKEAELVTSSSVTKANCSKIAVNGFKKYEISFFRATGRHSLQRVS